MTVSAIFTLVLFPSLLRLNGKDTAVDTDSRKKQSNAAELNTEPTSLASNH